MTEKALLAVQKSATRRKYKKLISFTMLWTLMRFVPTLQLCARTVEHQTYRCAVRTTLTSFEGILWCAVEASCDTRVWSVREAFQSETRPSIGIIQHYEMKRWVHVHQAKNFEKSTEPWGWQARCRWLCEWAFRLNQQLEQVSEIQSISSHQLAPTLVQSTISSSIRNKLQTTTTVQLCVRKSWR